MTNNKRFGNIRKKQQDVCRTFSYCSLLTSLAQDPPMRKFPGRVGGLKARQLMLSSGGDVTSTSCKDHRA